MVIKQDEMKVVVAVGAFNNNPGGFKRKKMILTY